MKIKGILPIDYCPRWQKHKSKKAQCCVPQCNAEARVTNHAFTLLTLCDCLGFAIIPSDDSSLPLCQSHYACVYRLCNQEMSCNVCGVRRKHEHTTSSVQRFIPCPEPHKVETFLKETLDHDCSLSAGDLVCYSCYKYCKHILETEDCLLSSDEILNELKQKEKQLEKSISELTSESSHSHIDLALRKTALYICKLVLNDHAVLFPESYAKFCQFLPFTETSISKARVLTYIGNEFGNLLSSTCCHKKVGRIFFRTKSDPFTLLSHALGSKTGVNEGNQQSQGTSTYTDHLNQQVHRLVSHFISEASSDTSLSTALDIDKFVRNVQHVAPDVWEHVCLLTRSVNERKGRKAAVNEETLSGHIKHLRRAYLLSVLLFCTNTQCCYPFHVQLADAVESCGGSAELLRILNRLGVTASLETLKRHIHNVSEIRKQTGIDGLLVDKAFTIASADNIDFLSSYLSVTKVNCTLI